MRVSVAWLREWVRSDWSVDEICERLTMAGIEVEAVEAVAPAFSGVVVGLVRKVSPHPMGADLRLAEVDIGDGRMRSVVCGAGNLREAIRAPLALPGAMLPGGRRIGMAEVRGVPSEGMLCSAHELGLEEQSAGLLILDGDAPPGVPLVEHLGLDDQMLTLGLTPNRGDCLSLQGVARELAALGAGPLTPPPFPKMPPRKGPLPSVSVAAPAACPRYCACLLEGVAPDGRSPDWLRERLRRGGIRAIHPVVDVANYVMLELGQPLHAFDADRLEGGIHVRMARPGETMEALDGTVLALEEDMLVIADGAGPAALAGIMGGRRTAVDEGSTRVVLESAFFAPQAIQGRARRLGLQTEASYRFERGVDPSLQERAMERALALIIAVTGARPGPVHCLRDAQHVPQGPAIRLRRSRIARVLGWPMADGEVQDSLSALGMEHRSVDGGWEIKVPSHRFDIGIEVDLIEELARVHGYDRIPASRPRAVLAPVPQPSGMDGPALRAALRHRDYDEVITYSFVPAVWQADVEPEVEPIALRNPLSQDLAVMRSSLWPGLLQTLRYNLNRQQGRVRIYELGRVFGKGGQALHLGGVVAGPAWREGWADERRGADFFDVKGDIESLLALWRCERAVFTPARHSALHPGQCAELRLEGESVGWLGVLHPRLQKLFDLETAPLLFAIDMDKMAARRSPEPRFHALSAFPGVRRDMALLVPEDVAAGDVLNALRGAAAPWVRSIRLFDRYIGEGVPAGQQSLAIALILQADDRTLTEEEVRVELERLLSALQGVCPARLRS